MGLIPCPMFMPDGNGGWEPTVPPWVMVLEAILVPVMLLPPCICLLLQ